jgi:hypothetical protein
MVYFGRTECDGRGDHDGRRGACPAARHGSGNRLHGPGEQAVTMMLQLSVLFSAARRLLGVCPYELSLVLAACHSHLK